MHQRQGCRSCYQYRQILHLEPMQDKYVLWLASWYPSEIDSLQGDFIQRHAQAVSMIHPIELWSFIEDRNAVITNDYLLTINDNGRLKEHIVYYHSTPKSRLIPYKWWRLYRMLMLSKKLINNHYHGRSLPSLVHTHIIMNLGITGRYLAAKWRIPHVVSDQWTAYLPEAIPNFRSFNAWSTRQWHLIMKNAAACTAVSEYLALHLRQLSGRTEITRIPNVVDGKRFQPAEKKFSQPTFITISADSYQKDLRDILQSVQLLKNKGLAFQLLVVHHADDALRQLVTQWAIEDFVTLMPPMPQNDLAILMAQCDAHILYSRYETFGCVIIESLACGVPVLAADISVLRELIVHEKNGLLVKPESPVALADAMATILDDQLLFSPENIRKQCLEQYSFDVIASQFSSLYQQLWQTGGKHSKS